MNDKYIKLAKKLKALTEQGEGGEKYNAQKKLQSLMKRYDITDDDINEDRRNAVKFRLRKEQVQLFFQIYITVVGWGRDLRRWKKPPSFGGGSGWVGWLERRSKDGWQRPIRHQAACYHQQAAKQNPRHNECNEGHCYRYAAFLCFTPTLRHINAVHVSGGIRGLFSLFQDHWKLVRRYPVIDVAPADTPDATAQFRAL